MPILNKFAFAGRLVFASALIATLIAGCSGKERERPQGVILIMIDTLRADHVGAYGSQLGLTPNIDQVAARGIVFEKAVAPSSWTKSSIGSLFASRYPTSIGVLGREDAIADGVTTLAETLRRDGFRTMGVITNMNAGRPFGFAQGFDSFETPDLKAGYPNDFKIHIARGVTEKALHIIDGLQGDRPFFLYLHYVDPHDPYLPHPGILPTPEPDGRFDGSRKRLQMLDRTPPENLTKADYDRIKYLYAGEVKYCDHWIGELLQGLEQRGLRDKVLLVITADHGEGLWDHGVRAHGQDLYEEMVHVPLILQFPAGRQIAAPRRVSEPVSLVDVAPTLLATLGIAQPADYWGTDLTPLMRGTPLRRKHSFIYTELDLDGHNLEAARDLDLKLVRNRAPAQNATPLQLYDLDGDPAETQNLADRSPAKLKNVLAVLDRASRAVASNVSATTQVSTHDLDKETKNSLRALGYLGGPGSSPRPEAPLESTISFSSQNHPAEQLIEGFYDVENGTRWMAGRASVELGRKEGQKKWRIEGWIDLTLHHRKSLKLTVRANDAPPQKRRIKASGTFVLEGALPADSQDPVRLDIECGHEFQPSASHPGGDARKLCVVVKSVGLI